MKYLLPFSGPIVEAIFLGRPQRFLAEMSLPDGNGTIAYCSNPGSLCGCLISGSKALLLDSCDNKRKLKYTWVAIQIDGVFVGIDTHLANRIVENAILSKMITNLVMYDELKREVNIGAIRADFVLANKECRCIIEVKSATIVENRVARFPDSITPRSLRQLAELSDRVIAGERAIIIFVVQRDDVTGFRVTDKFYPAYATAFRRAIAIGVEVIALAVPLNAGGIGSPRVLPVLTD